MVRSPQRPRHECPPSRTRATTSGPRWLRLNGHAIDTSWILASRAVAASLKGRPPWARGRLQQITNSIPPTRPLLPGHRRQPDHPGRLAPKISTATVAGAGHPAFAFAGSAFGKLIPHRGAPILDTLAGRSSPPTPSASSDGQLVDRRPIAGSVSVGTRDGPPWALRFV